MNMMYSTLIVFFSIINSHAQELLNAIKKFYLADLETVQIDGVSADPPKPLPW